MDIGASSTAVAVVEFTAGKLNVLSTSSDAHLGGRSFDRLLADHFAAYVKDKYKLDVLSNEKATMKLYKECERVKKILSANSKVLFAVEYIMNDTDVKVRLLILQTNLFCV
jgi:molecular chaperone DnaK (HSP70)